MPIKHRLYKHPLYEVWKVMKKRCYNPNCKSYKNYGGRGIMIYYEWKDDFKKFYDWTMLNGYKKGLTIDRIDNDGNYEPSNCRFATRIIQGRNRRKQKNNTSGFVGVGLKKNRWESKIVILGKSKFIGSYNSAKEAAMARDKYIISNNLVGFNLQCSEGM